MAGQADAPIYEGRERQDFPLNCSNYARHLLLRKLAGNDPLVDVVVEGARVVGLEGLEALEVVHFQHRLLLEVEPRQLVLRVLVEGLGFRVRRWWWRRAQAFRRAEQEVQLVGGVLEEELGVRSERLIQL